MHSKKMRLLCALLSAALASAALVSCGSAPTEGEASSQSTSAAESVTEAPVTTEFDPMASLDAFDGKGTEFKVMGYGGSTANYRQAEYFRAAELNGDVINDALYYRNSDVEDLYNLKISYMLDMADSDALKQMQTLSLAGDKTYDIYEHKGAHMPVLIQAGAIAAWNNVGHIDVEQPWYSQDAVSAHSIAKKTYGLFGDVLSTNTTCCWAFMFNKKLAENYKLESPYKTVRDGKWTIDFVSEQTKDIATDLDGDGKWTEKDFYGVGADKWATLDAWQVSFNIYGISKDKDDLPYDSFFSERTVTAFEKVYDFYYNNVGTLVNQVYAYDSVNVFADDRCIYLPMFIDYMLGDTLRAMESDFGVLPYPMLDEKQDGYSTYVLPRYGAVMLPITASADRLDMIGAVVEALGAASYKYVRPAIYDVALKVKMARDAESEEMLDLLMATRHYDLAAVFEVIGTYPFAPAKSFRANLSSGKEFNVTSWYESVKGQASAALVSFMEKVK